MDGQNEYRHPERPDYPIPEKDPLSAPRGVITAIIISMAIVALVFLCLAVGEILWRLIPVEPRLRPAVACGGFTMVLAGLVTWWAFHRFRHYLPWVSLAWVSALIWALSLHCWATVGGW